MRKNAACNFSIVIEHVDASNDDCVWACTATSIRLLIRKRKLYIARPAASFDAECGRRFSCKHGGTPVGVLSLRYRWAGAKRRALHRQGQERVVESAFRKEKRVRNLSASSRAKTRRR